MVAPKTAEVRDLLNYLAIYEATPPTLADGEAHNLTLTSDGKLRTYDPTVEGEVVAIEAKLDSATYGLAALKALLVIAQADLDNPNQYKADVSALALEATLTAMKGAGWSTETLKAIKDAIAAITTERGTDGAALASSWTAALATALASYTAVRAGYLDNINNAQLLNISATILGRIDAAISSRLATASYTAERGTDSAMLAVNGALEATLTAMKGAGWSTETLHAIYDAIGAISGGATAQQVWEYATRVLTNLSDTRAAKIDNLDAAISTRLASASYTAERGTDNAALAAVCTEARLARLDTTISSRATAVVAYYYSGALANLTVYVPAAGKIIDIAYIAVDIASIQKWCCYDTAISAYLVDAHTHLVQGAHRSIQGPIYCDGTKIGFRNATGDVFTIYLYGHNA